MPKSLHHLALGAVDVAAVARFYAELFGLAEVARHDDAEGALRSIWLDLGGALLMVERTTEPERRSAIGRGPFLLAFRVDRAERAPFEERLARQGVAVESRTAYSSYFRDPEGNRVAISHHPE